MDSFKSKVCGGFPVLVNITHFQPGDPGYIGGLPENCWPPEAADVEFELTTLKGAPCPWIERKMTDAEWERLTNEAVSFCENYEDY